MGASPIAGSEKGAGGSITSSRFGFLRPPPQNPPSLANAFEEHIRSSKFLFKENHFSRLFFVKRVFAIKWQLRISAYLCVNIRKRAD